jgi:glycosyltransferase involved in cell wall biosynthesis
LKIEVNKLALVTPWPPQMSGIADYAYELAACMLGPSVDLHILTNESAPVGLPGVTFHQLHELSAGQLDLAAFDGILVQLGNHPHFHGYMIDVIRQFTCTVELHDLLLHHCLMGDFRTPAGERDYYESLTGGYGADVADQFRHFFSQNRDILQCPFATKYPCSDFITAGAERVIVHSRFAKAALVAAGKVPNIVAINLCSRREGELCDPPTESNRVRIGVFGGVQRNRQVDVVLEVLAKINLECQDWSLDVIGSIDDDCAALLKAPQELGIQEKVTFHGRLRLDDLQEAMRQCDIMVSLRSPTMGETSAIVVRAMQLGIASIVSDVGWYSELPSCVLKVDNSRIHQDLEKSLRSLLRDRSVRKRLAERTAAYAAQRFDLRVAADDILLTLFGSVDEAETPR